MTSNSMLCNCLIFYLIVEAIALKPMRLFEDSPFPTHPISSVLEAVLVLTNPDLSSREHLIVCEKGTTKPSLTITMITDKRRLEDVSVLTCFMM